MLSRNFRLQRVGNLDWLQRNYNFSRIASFIDELIILDVSRGERNLNFFCETLKNLSSGCFVPIAAGGGIASLTYAKQLLRSGADKLVVNSSLFNNPELVRNLAKEFGQQSIVGSIDMKRIDKNQLRIYTDSGSSQLLMPPTEALALANNGSIGEFYLNSIDKDGTGQGYDFSLLEQIPSNCELPIILAGGVGNGSHLLSGFDDERVDAVATAHLFNFIGDGLQRVREDMLTKGKKLASWPININL